MAKGVFVFKVLTLLILHPGISYSQFVVQNVSSPQYLVENVLLGNGVSVSNVSYTGSTLSLGSFTQGSSSILGLSSGIVLSTGRVMDLSSVNNVPNRQFNTQGGSDANLQSLTPMNNIYDAAVLEFDFVPTTDSIQFKFVFGSEEYAEWIGSNFNDVFGFFITGSSPYGGQYSNHNIAVIPGTNTPISTNTINAGINNIGSCNNCNYYIDNTNGTSLQLDGLTTVITTGISVVPCQTYHFKIAIGDGSDHSYDSGVFLEANSFTSLGLSYNTTLSNNSPSNKINEDCDSAAIDFALTSILNYDYYLPLNFIGTAQNGIDFQTLPDSILIPAGSDSVRIYLLPFADNIIEGIENFSLVFPVSGCTYDTININIEDYSPIITKIIGDSVYCQGSQINQIANVSGGIQPYNYYWDNGSTSNNISFIAQQDTNIDLIVTDGCGNSENAIKNIVVNPNPSITLTASIDSACKGDVSVLKAIGASNYNWYKDNVLDINNHSDSIQVPLMANASIKVVGTNQFGCTASKTRVITMHTPINLVATPTLNAICSGDTANFTIDGASYYDWGTSNIVNHNLDYSNVNLYTNVTDSFWVKGVDSYSCVDSIELIIDVRPLPQLNVQSTYDTICSNNNTTLSADGAISYQWWTNQMPSQLISGSSINISPLTSIDYYVKGSNLQSCSVIDSVHIEVYTKPKVKIKLLTGASVCFGDSAQIIASGTDFYYWLDNETVISNNTNSIYYTPNSTTIISAVGVDVFGCSDTASAEIHIRPDFEIKLLEDVVCEGTNAQVSVKSYDQSQNYIWNNGQTGTITDYTITGSTQVYVTATDTSGCQRSDSVMINVFSQSDFSVSPSVQTICEGEKALVVAHNTAVLDTFWWSAADIWHSNLFDSIKVNPHTNINVGLIGIDTNGCELTSSNVASIIVNPLPNIQLSTSYAEVQPMSQYYMSATGGISYLWSPVAAILVAGANNILLATDTLTHFYVQGTDTNGCVNYDTAIISPRPLVRIVTSNRHICLGDSTYIEASASVNCTYQWNTGEYTKGIWVMPNTTTSYNVTVLDSLGFYNNASITISVYTKPNITTNANPIYVCEGGSSVIRAFGAKYYSWFPEEHLNKTAGSTVVTNAQQNTSYRIIGIDKFGCIDTAYVPVVVVSNPVISISNSYFDICEGQSINISASGATNYKWYPGNYYNDSIVSSVIAKPDKTDELKVIGTNIYGCTDSKSVKVIVRESPSLSIKNKSKEICIGQKVTLKVSGANSYTWFPSLGLSSTTDSITVASPNISTTYTVVGTNTNGCADSVLTQIGVHTYPNININPTNSQVCPNDSAVLTAIGATTYSWYPNLYLDTNKGNMVTSLPDTSITYRVIGENDYGCSDTAWNTLDVMPISKIKTAKNHVCAGDTVILSAYTNTSNVNYLWSNGSTNSQISIYPTSSQWVHLNTSLSNGCSSDTSVYIEVEANPVVNISASDLTVCSGQMANLHASGAVLYRWTSDSNNMLLNGSDISIHQNNINTYYVEGRTLLGCKDTASISIGIYETPNVSVSPDFTQICSGSYQLLEASGADNYMWYPNIGLSSNVGDSVVVLPNTNMSYMVVGIDSNGCQDTAYANFVTYASASISPLNPNICYGDTIQLTISIQNQASSYIWNTGDTNSFVDVAPLTSKNYKITITYNAGCSKVSSTNVIVHHDSSVVAQTTTPLVCIGDTAKLKAVNGNSFTWFGNGLINSNDSIVNATPNSNTWYKVNAISAHNCLSQDSVQVNIYSKPSINLVSNASGVCDGDSIELTASGGNSYKWLYPNINSTSSNCFVKVKPINTFKVIGYDYNLCRDTASITIQAHSLPSFNLTPSSIAVCPSDSLLIQINGNNTNTWAYSPYMNVISNSEAYIFPVANTFFNVTSIDSMGCVNDTTIRSDIKRRPISYYNTDSAAICIGDSVKLTAIGADDYFWSPNPLISNAMRDTVYFKPQQTDFYKITGVSSDGCSKTDSIQIIVSQKPALTITSDKNVYCHGDSVFLTATSSNIATNFTWQNGDTSSVYMAEIDSISSFKLVGASYLGCQDSTEISLSIYDRPNITIDVADSTLCQGDTVNLFGVGDSSLSYQWSTGAQTNIIYDTPMSSQLYSLIAQDSNACMDTAYSYVYVNALPMISINTSSNNICNNDSVILNANYTDSSLAISWNTGDINDQIIKNPQNSILYSLQAIDSLGCLNIDSVFVTVNPAPQFSFFPSNPEVCNGDSIILSIVSNNNNLDYFWGVGDTVANIEVSPIANNNYSATVTDSNGCFNSDTVLVNVHSLPNITIGVIPPLLCNGDTGIIEIIPNPSIINFQWNTGDSIRMIEISPNITSTYSITVTDTNNCSNTFTAEVIVAPLPNINIVSSDSVICSYDTLALNVNSNIPLSGAIWNTGQTGYSVLEVPLSSQSYSVIAQDTNGCNGYDTTSVIVNQRPICEISIDTSICENETTQASYNGNATINGIYHWSFEGTPTAVGTGVGPINLTWNQAGNYKVHLYVEDFACVSFPDSAYVEVNPLPVVDFDVLTSQHCDSSAVAFVNNSNGMMSYDWNFGDPLSSHDTSSLQNPSYVYSVPGLYDVNLKLTTFAGCSQSLTKNSIVEVFPKPNASFRVNTYKPDPSHPVVNFYNYSSDYTNMKWNFGEPASGIYNESVDNNPYHIYLSEGVFNPKLIVTNDYNCGDTSSVTIDIASSPTIYAPKAFTPNGDGLNETFTTVFSKEDIENYEINIYNRLGLLVYHSTDYHQGWDGNDQFRGDACQTDVFTYVVYITDSRNVKRKFSGAVTLFR